MIQTEQPSEGVPVALVGTAIKSSSGQLLSQGGKDKGCLSSSNTLLLGTVIVHLGFPYQLHRKGVEWSGWSSDCVLCGKETLDSPGGECWARQERMRCEDRVGGGGVWGLQQQNSVEHGELCLEY